MIVFINTSYTSYVINLIFVYNIYHLNKRIMYEAILS